MSSDVLTPAEPPSTDTVARPLRITFLVSEDQRSGTYFRYQSLGASLARLGHTVTVLSQGAHRWGWRRETREGVAYLLAPTFPGNSRIHSATNPVNVLYRLLRSGPRADVYHLFQPFPAAAAQWLRLRALHRESVFAYDWDDLLLNEHSSLLRPRSWKDRLLAFFARWTEGNLPRNADLVTAISMPLSALAHQRGAREVALLHNGCTPFAPPSREAARAVLSLQPDATYLGFTGWAAPEMEWILRSLSALMPEFPNLRLAISGVRPGDVVDLNAFPGLMERIDYFRFETAEECRILQSAIDLGLLPLADIEFNRYRLPMKFHDYLSCGAPVVCCDVGEVGSLGRAMPGVILCPATLEGWIDGVRTGISEFLAGRLAGRAEILQAAAAHSWDAMAERLVSLYRERLAVAAPQH